MGKIILYTKGESWIAQFPADSDVAQIMGARDIPTAFTARAAAEKVRAEIERLNPGYIVQVGA